MPTMNETHGGVASNSTDIWKAFAKVGSGMTPYG